MNSKNIKRHLKAKLNDWAKHIDDEDVRKVLKENVIVTGGAIVSLLTGEDVNDYDVYFRTKEACITVASYYADKWNFTHGDPNETVTLKVDEETGRVGCFISSGIAGKVDEPEDDINFNLDEKPTSDDEEKEKYKPRFITSNAITLSDKVQLVTRFYGEVSDIHKNYDFAHCTCAWSSWDNEVFLPQKALECIINKELYYIGSLYPLCSIIRTRKYIDRGYYINAGQYVKMAMQLINKLKESWDI